MPKCNTIDQRIMQEAIAMEAAIDLARRHNEGWRRAESEYEASHGTDFGHPCPFPNGSAEADGYRDFVIAMTEEYETFEEDL